MAQSPSEFKRSIQSTSRHGPALLAAHAAVVLVPVAGSIACMLAARTKGHEDGTDRYRPWVVPVGGLLAILGALLIGAGLAGYTWGLLGGASWGLATAQLVAARRGSPIDPHDIPRAISTSGSGRWRVGLGYALGALAGGLLTASVPVALIAGGLSAGWAAGRALSRRPETVQRAAVVDE